MEKATGKKIVEIAAKHIGEKYVLGTLVPKSKKSYVGPWDCAEFVTWVIYQATGKLYGCANNAGNPDTADAYTGFWARDAKLLGKVCSIDTAIATPGSALLRVAGNGLIGHIVISTGNGNTIEAHSSKYGVMRNRVSGRRWDFGIMVPWVNYSKDDITNISEIENEKPTGTIYRFTKPLMRSNVIKEIQRQLGIPMDGIFGQETFNAVRAYQAAKGLVADGEVGPKTLAELGILLGLL